MNKIKLDIAGLSYSQTQSGAYALVLAEAGGKRQLPIIIGGFELEGLGDTTIVRWVISRLGRNNQTASTSFTTSAITFQKKTTNITGTQQFDTIGFYQNNTSSPVPIYLNISVTYNALSFPPSITTDYLIFKAIKMA
jgi:hypothetical protein